jgi:hypothetical protein
MEMTMSTLFDITVEQIRPKIFHLKFKNQYELTSTFLRLEEFYESSFENIQGKHFTLEEFMDTYAKQYGNFTYTSDWNGFNVPSNVIRKFFTIFWLDLLVKEKHLFTIISPILNDHADFYLIATHKNDSLSHEIAHGYYYLDENYRNSMNTLIDSYEHKINLEKCLEEKGYNKQVVPDEIQAYLATAKQQYLIDRLNFDESWIFQEKFQNIFMQKEKNYDNN